MRVCDIRKGKSECWLVAGLLLSKCALTCTAIELHWQMFVLLDF